MNVFEDLDIGTPGTPGASVNVASFSEGKEFIFEGPANFEFTIEFSHDDIDWFDLKTYKGVGSGASADKDTRDIVAEFMRCSVAAGKVAPTNVDVAGVAGGTLKLVLAVPTGVGVGPSNDISALGSFNTLTVGAFTDGELEFEVSQDGSTWEPCFKLKPGHPYDSAPFVAGFCRINRISGTGTPNAILCASNDSVTVDSMPAPNRIVYRQNATGFLPPGVHATWAAVYADFRIRRDRGMGHIIIEGDASLSGVVEAKFGLPVVEIPSSQGETGAIWDLTDCSLVATAGGSSGFKALEGCGFGGTLTQIGGYEGSSSTIFEFDGDHSESYDIGYDGGGGTPFVLNDKLTFSGGGVGRLMTHAGDGTTGTIKFRMLSGTAPVNDETFTADKSTGNAVVNGALVAVGLNIDAPVVVTNAGLIFAEGVNIHSAPGASPALYCSGVFVPILAQGNGFPEIGEDGFPPTIDNSGCVALVIALSGILNLFPDSIDGTRFIILNPNNVVGCVGEGWDPANQLTTLLAHTDAKGQAITNLVKDELNYKGRAIGYGEIVLLDTHVYLTSYDGGSGTSFLSPGDAIAFPSGTGVILEVTGDGTTGTFHFRLLTGTAPANDDAWSTEEYAGAYDGGAGVPLAVGATLTFPAGVGTVIGIDALDDGVAGSLDWLLTSGSAPINDDAWTANIYSVGYDGGNGTPMAPGEDLTFPAGVGVVVATTGDGTTGTVDFRLASGAAPANDDAFSSSGGFAGDINGTPTQAAGAINGTPTQVTGDIDGTPAFDGAFTLPTGWRGLGGTRCGLKDSTGNAAANPVSLEAKVGETIDGAASSSLNGDNDTLEAMCTLLPNWAIMHSVPFGAAGGSLSGTYPNPGIAVLAVGTPELAAGAVTAAKAGVFVSTEQTGTGAPQNVAHGLGATPSLVFVSITDDNAAAFSIVEGAHDGTNVVVTVTLSAKFKVLAWV